MEPPGAYAQRVAEGRAVQLLRDDVRHFGADALLEVHHAAEPGGLARNQSFEGVLNMSFLAFLPAFGSEPELPRASEQPPGFGWLLAKEPGP